MKEEKVTQELLEGVRRGDDAAFAALCDQFSVLLDGAVRRFSEGLCEADKAEVAQEARIAFFRAAATYRFSKEITFGLYARVCVRNALITRYRKETKKAVLCSFDDHIDTLLPFSVDEPFAALSAEESVKNMYRRIATVLSDYERRVFDLYVEGADAALIGARLGKTEKSVYNATARMLAKLRVEFGT